jgi:hypothetical protein
VAQRKAALARSLTAELQDAGLDPRDPDLSELLFVHRAGQLAVERTGRALIAAHKALDHGEPLAAEESLRLAEFTAADAVHFGATPPGRGPAWRRLALAWALRWGIALLPLLALAGWTFSRGRRRAPVPNPFVTGSPVRDQRLFVGRDGLVEKLLAGLTAGHSWTVSGERRIGKTSLALQVGAAWEGRGGVAVFVDLAGTHGPIPALREALDQRARMSDPDVPQDLPTLARALADPGRLLLVLDEVDSLHESPESDLSQIRALLAGPQAPAVALFSGIGLKAERLGIALEPLEVPPLDDRFVRALLAEPLRGSVRCEMDALARVVALAQGRPMRVQLLGLYLVTRLNRLGHRTIRAQDVHAVQVQLETSWEAIQQEAAPLPGGTEDLNHLVAEVLALARELT